MITDLHAAMERVNREYFNFDELPEIIWSKGKMQKRYTKLILGTYDIRKNQIRVHPLFRHCEMPMYVIDFVLYHELLHYEDRYWLKEKKRGERVHDQGFHKREKIFPFTKEAMRYVKDWMTGGKKSDENPRN